MQRLTIVYGPSLANSGDMALTPRFTIVLARVFLVAAALAGLLISHWPLGEMPSAGAQSAPTVSVRPSVAAPGEKVTIEGSGWPASAQLVAQIYEASGIGGASSALGGVIQTDPAGNFSFQGTVPLSLFGQGSRGTLNVVPGRYVIVVSSPGGGSVPAPLAVGAPNQGGLLWGQVYFDTNNSGAIDAGDMTAGGLVGVKVTGPLQESAPRQAITDAKGRFMLVPIQAGSYTLTVSTQRFSTDWTGSITAVVQESQDTLANVLLRPSPPNVQPERYFQETGFAVENDAFWDYFAHRGGVRTLGYPISRTFIFQGYPTQFFQRIILQEIPGEGVQRLNLLDPGLMPYTRINGSIFPGVDPSVKSATPRADSSDYDTQVIDFVREHAPNEFGEKRTGFFDAFSGTVTAADAFPEGNHEELVPLLNLEIWGTPTSNPTPDPNNSNFVYLRFQRGIMHFQGYDASGNPITEGILLGDWFKSLITGRDLPSDLESQARADGSPYLRQYDPSKPGWLADPTKLPNTDFTFAFERQ